jgi:3-keto-5-aminohexanoate cleavage enzyme
MRQTGEPLIVNLAPTGMVPTRQMSAHVPLQPAEIVRDVLAAAATGVTIAHLHARDESGQPTHGRDVYARIIGGIRDKRPDLVICVSCSGRRARRVEDRAEVLDLDGDEKPDMASLTVSSLNFAHEASVNAPDTVRDLAERMRDRGIVPEIEIFDLGMANVLRYLESRGIVRSPVYANLLFGNLATAQADLPDIAAVVSRLPAGAIWSQAGLGAAQLPVAAIAAAVAPGVRIGLEDNLWLDPARTQPASNADLIERVHGLAALLGRPIMRPVQFRERLGLPVRA